MLKISDIVSQIDSFVWGPVMLVLLVGTGVLLTVRCNFLTWRNLPWALKKTLSKEARTKSRGTGDVSPFSALTTALAATIGTGNIVGVATAMVSAPSALVAKVVEPPPSKFTAAMQPASSMICAISIAAPPAEKGS